MEQIRAIIIDDEKPGRENLKAILLSYFAEIDVIGEASNYDDAKSIITELKPNLIFLDIELQSKSGLDLLQHFEHPNFEVIFVTAFGDYAVKAFRTIATDFIMKPIDITELGEAINKAKHKLQLLNLENKQKIEEKLASRLLRVSTVEGIENIKYENILYFQAINYYTNIVLTNGKEIISSKHLKEYEELVKDSSFFRVHNSFVINTQYFSQMIAKEGYFAILNNGVSIKISRRRKDDFLLFLENKSKL